MKRQRLFGKATVKAYLWLMFIGFVLVSNMEPVVVHKAMWLMSFFSIGGILIMLMGRDEGLEFSAVVTMVLGAVGLQFGGPETPIEAWCWFQVCIFGPALLLVLKRIANYRDRPNYSIRRAPMPAMLPPGELRPTMTSPTTR